MHDVVPILWEYFYLVNLEDLSEVTETVFLGQKLKMSLVERELYHFLHKGCEIQMAYNGDEIVGFMIYHNIYDCLIAVHCLYLEQQYFKKGLGKNMVKSIESDKIKITKVLFQTNRERPPEQFMKSSVNKYGRKIGESGKMDTWEMDWS